MKNNSTQEEGTAAWKKDPYQIKNVTQSDILCNSESEIMEAFLARGLWKATAAPTASSNASSRS